MNIGSYVFRVDASIDIGTGHVRRCMTLASALKNIGHHTQFICRDHPGHLIDQLKKEGHEVAVLPKASENQIKSDKIGFYEKWLGASWEIDAIQTVSAIQKNKNYWLIVDHYGIDEKWERIVRAYFDGIMVIDDLGNRDHFCDILVDQNYGANKRKYEGLIPKKSKILLGTDYCILREEFLMLRQKALDRRKKNLNAEFVLITLGGVDKDNYSSAILDKLKEFGFLEKFYVKLVVGGNSPNIETLEAKSKESHGKIQLVIDAPNMAGLMCDADICIGAAGGTTWERCCLGLPTIQVAIAENQIKIAEDLSEIGAVKYLKNLNELEWLLSNASIWMQDCSLISSRLVDGLGVSRILSELKNA